MKFKLEFLIAVCLSISTVCASYNPIEEGKELNIRPTFDVDFNHLPLVLVPVKKMQQVYSIDIDTMLPAYSFAKTLSSWGVYMPYIVEYKMRKAIVAILARYPIEVEFSWTTFTRIGEWDVLSKLINFQQIEDQDLLNKFHEKNPTIARIRLTSLDFGVNLVDMHRNSVLNTLFDI